jgi:hypothetical protein
LAPGFLALLDSGGSLENSDINHLFSQRQGQMALPFLCTFQTVIVNFLVYLLKTLVGEI